ncbi:MAG: hypothetical protein Fur0022_00440 [Anaerolineales bacterium]
MKQLIRITLLGVLILFSSVTTAIAKGPADKLSISGPGLTEPIEVTDPKILQPFSPWGDRFYDGQTGALAELPKVDVQYQVLFYVEDEAGELRVRYAFQYTPGQPGLIHLPGKGDEWYETNIGTILRGGLEGQWLYASQEWDDLMRQLLEGQGIPFSGDAQRSKDTAKVATDGTSEQKGVSSSAAQTIEAGLYSPILWLGIGLAAVLALVFLRRALAKAFR